MRITDPERQAILRTAKEIYGDNARVTLFGSRVDDRLKGGDIDLYVETEGPATLKDKLKFLVELENKIGEQKIDLVVRTPDSPQKEIYDVAKKTGQVL